MHLLNTVIFSNKTGNHIYYHSKYDPRTQPPPLVFMPCLQLHAFPKAPALPTYPMIPYSSRFLLSIYSPITLSTVFFHHFFTKQTIMPFTFFENGVIEYSGNDETELFCFLKHGKLYFRPIVLRLLTMKSFSDQKTLLRAVIDSGLLIRHIEATLCSYFQFGSDCFLPELVNLRGLKHLHLKYHAAPNDRQSIRNQMLAFFTIFQHSSTCLKTIKLENFDLGCAWDNSDDLHGLWDDMMEKLISCARSINKLKNLSSLCLMSCSLELLQPQEQSSENLTHELKKMNITHFMPGILFPYFYNGAPWSSNLISLDISDMGYIGADETFYLKNMLVSITTLKRSWSYFAIKVRPLLYQEFHHYLLSNPTINDLMVVTETTKMSISEYNILLDIKNSTNINAFRLKKTTKDNNTSTPYWNDSDLLSKFAQTMQDNYTITTLQVVDQEFKISYPNLIRDDMRVDDHNNIFYTMGLDNTEKQLQFICCCNKRGRKMIIDKTTTPHYWYNLLQHGGSDENGVIHHLIRLDPNTFAESMLKLHSNSH